MAARFVHLGDLHLGPNSRNADRIAALDQIVSTEINRPVAAWLWPGDLNHGRMTIDDRNLLTRYLRMMADHAPVVIAYGNHDLPGDLDVFARLASTWPIRVVARPETLRVELATGGHAAIFVLPYPTRAGLVAAGVPVTSLVDAARLALDVIFIGAASELQAAAADGCVPLMVGHVNVAGAIVSTGQPNIGAEIEIDHALLDRLGPSLNVYKGLNHIHKAQLIGGAYYAGSCCRLDWGEIDEKGYTVATYDDRVWFVEFHKLDVAPMYHVEGELTREGFDWHIVGDVLKLTEAGDTSPQPMLDFTGCEVRVRYRFNADKKTALDEAIVREPFTGAKRLELDPIAVRNRASRAPEVAAAQTLEGKVEAFVRQSRVAWTPGLADKLAALQQVDGAAFLTQVHHGLSGAAEVDSPASDTAAAVSAVADDVRAPSEAASGNEMTEMLL